MAIANRTYAISSQGRNGFNPSVKIESRPKSKPTMKNTGPAYASVLAVEYTALIVGTWRVATARWVRYADPYVAATAVNMLRTCRKTVSRIGSLRAQWAVSSPAISSKTVVWRSTSD